MYAHCQNVLAQKCRIRIPKSLGKAWLRNRIEIYKFFIVALESFPILLAGNRIKWTLLPLSCTSLTQNGTLTFIRIPCVTGSTAMRWLLPRHRFNHRSVRASPKLAGTVKLWPLQMPQKCQRLPVAVLEERAQTLS